LPSAAADPRDHLALLDGGVVTDKRVEDELDQFGADDTQDVTRRALEAGLVRGCR
jgi:hypothetical protein